ncbi:hypothetical protein B5S33_g4943 [[Candida] boidinii]|nr:hypothetical protein B5S30_g4267 [[Candida] boidinii]OWB86259.1 hypothetical protein B5S33_g4943 [[Candida] boidinii]
MFVFYGEKNKSYRLRDHFKVSKTTTEETEDEFINATQEEQSGVIINAENSSDYQDFLSFSRDAYKPQNKFECLDGEHSDDDDVSEDVSFETCSTFYSRSEASIASINEEEEEEEIEIKDEVDEPKFNDESKVFANEHYVANTVCAEPPVFGIFGRSFPLSRVCSDATVVPSLEPELVEDKLPPPPTPPPATASKIRKRDYLYNYFHSSKNKNQVENEETIFTTDEVNDESNNNENNTEEEKTVAESQDITHEDDIQSTDGAENHQLDTNPSYFPSFLRKNLFYQAPTSAGNSIAETIIDREALRKELLASLGEGERREAEERYGAYFQEKQAVKELRDSFVEQTNHKGNERN